MTELVLHLPLPPPLSACFKNAAKRGRVTTKRYDAWQQIALLRAREQMRDLRWPPYFVNVQVDYQFGRPDKRIRDLGNLEKATSDLLVKLGVLRDDSQIVDLRMRWADVDGAIVTVRLA